MGEAGRGLIWSHSGLYSLHKLVEDDQGLWWETEMWHVVGDTDVDINWYTKRLTLLGVYKATELAMMQDQSEGFAETWSFLDRRFDDTKNVKELLGAPDDALKILGAVGNTVQAFLGVKR